MKEQTDKKVETPLTDAWERDYTFRDSHNRYADAFHDLLLFARRLEREARAAIIVECRERLTLTGHHAAVQALTTMLIRAQQGETTPSATREKDAARWQALLWRWGSGTVTLEYSDDGYPTLHVEHAEARDEFYKGQTPEEVIDQAIAAVDAVDEQPYVGQSKT